MVKYYANTRYEYSTDEEEVEVVIKMKKKHKKLLEEAGANLGLNLQDFIILCLRLKD